MKCRSICKLIYKQLDDELDTRSEEAFMAHLADCPACRQEWQQAQAADANLRRAVVPDEDDPRFVPEVMTQVRAAKAWHGVQLYRFAISRRALHGALGTTVAVCAALAYTFFGRSPTAPTPEPGPRTAHLPETDLPEAAAPQPPPTPDTNEQPPKEVEPVPPKPRPRPRPKPHPAPRPTKVLPVVAHLASTGAILVRSASGGDWQSHEQGQPVRKGELVQPSGATGRVKTVQGHEVLLSPASVTQFRGESLALFRGEVFVEAKPSSRGFVVKTPGTRTVVHGTRFNVKLVGQAAQVTVVEGEVQVGTAAGKCLLTARQQTTASPGRAPSPPTLVEVAPLIAWTGLHMPTAPSVAKDLTGVSLTAALAEDSRAPAAGVPVTFVVTLDYLDTAPTRLELVTTITDGTGKTVTEREDLVADRAHRYRVKKIALDPLPAGQYAGRFSLRSADRSTVRQLQFSVGPPPAAETASAPQPITAQ